MVHHTALATRAFSGRIARASVVGALAITLAACGSQTARVDPALGVSASQRVVQDGEAVPKGGGRAHVGRPYTIAGRTYVPRYEPDYSSEGLASWYGGNFHGRKTANGEIFDRWAMSAAHTTMPLPSYARVTNLENSHSVIVRVNDRGPFHGNRVIDVSRATAEALDFKNDGVARVRVDYVGPASTEGSDDTVLMATLRTDGRLAEMPIEGATSIMVASAGGVPQVDRQPLAAADRPVAPTLAFASAPPLTGLPVPPSRPPAAMASLQAAPQPVPPVAVAQQGPSLRGAVPASRLAEPVQLVGIFFAAPDLPAQGFTRGGPFGAVQAQDAATLRR